MKKLLLLTVASMGLCFVAVESQAQNMMEECAKVFQTKKDGKGYTPEQLEGLPDFFYGDCEKCVEQAIKEKEANEKFEAEQKRLKSELEAKKEQVKQKTKEVKKKKQEYKKSKKASSASKSSKGKKKNNKK